MLFIWDKIIRVCKILVKIDELLADVKSLFDS